VGLERDPFSLVRVTEELLDPQKLAVTSPTCGGRSVGKATEFGRAIAQAVSRWLPTAAAWVRAGAGKWDLWWTKWRRGMFSVSTSVYNHPGQVQ
jgi:hypothetical protein